MMEKAYNSKEVSKWKNLNKEILVIIFNKLDVMDLTMGVSRVCISWFLASHDKTLWQTVDLAKLQQVVMSLSPWWKDKARPLVFYKHRVDRLSFRKMISFFSCMQGDIEKGTSLSKLLTEITKFSGTVPKNLIFNSFSYIKEEDLMFAAQRMPNIEKLVLSRWCYQTEKSSRFAFSQWKNLKTLIISHDDDINGEFEFQVVGENCSNLTNFKYISFLAQYNAEQILRCFKKLKRLSLRCSCVFNAGVLSLINGLQNHVILNLTHCVFVDFGLDGQVRMNKLPNDNIVQAATQKLENFIKCSDCCSFCERWMDRFTLTSKDVIKWRDCDKDWENDEIEEFVF